MSRFSIRRAAGVVVSAAALLLASGTVYGQGGRGGGGQGGGMNAMLGGMGGFRMGGQQGQVMPQATLDRYQRMLGLSLEQREKVKEAYNAYKAQYEVEEAAMQEKVADARADARESGDMGEAFRAMQAPMEEFSKTQERMRQEFMSRFKATLTAEQAANWPRIERAIKREQASAGMMVAGGERPDLTAIVDKLQLADEARGPVEEVLQVYETEMDRELTARAKVNEEVMAKLQELRPQNMGGGGQGGNRGGDRPGPEMFREMLEKMQPVIDRAREASGKVSEINRRFAARVQAALPEEKRPAFLRLVKEAKYPNVYQPGIGARQLNAALELPDLTDKQRESLKALQAKYNKDLVAVNDKLAAATEKDEAARLAQPGLGFGMGGGGGFRASPELADLRQDKRELDQETAAEIAALLSEEQVAKLPRLEQRNFGGQGGRGGERGRDGGGRGGNRGG